MKGRAHAYSRDHINTDEIIPARYLNMDRKEELAKHAMEGLDSGFTGRVRVGDFIVAGQDFGCGSSREHAVWALEGSGIRAVVAISFARIFFRNCINNGFPAIECREACMKVEDGDTLEIIIKEGRIVNHKRKETYVFPPLPDFASEIMEEGGLMNYIKRRDKNE